jgi:hypothetical protein
LSENWICDERGDGGDDRQERESLPDVVVADAFRHQRPEQRKLALPDGAKALDERELPKVLKEEFLKF